MKKVAVIGGGIAGMETAVQLDRMGYQVILFEKNDTCGGQVSRWYKLSPDLRPAAKVLDPTMILLKASGVDVRISSWVANVRKQDGVFYIEDQDNGITNVHAVVIATGFDLFDARIKEEYGYGLYKNVITSADLEERFRNGTIVDSGGRFPHRIGFVHCVGSRDEKCGNLYCSKVCCITGVKQAIELKEFLPGTEIFCFYMDMRMFGPHYEELYMEAQEKWGIKFVRGRVSETAENADGSIQLKTEDTLVSRPLKMNVDMLVLLAGMVPSEGTRSVGRLFGVDFNNNGFIRPGDEHLNTNHTNVRGVFTAGSCIAPMNITDAANHARSGALAINHFLKSTT